MRLMRDAIVLVRATAADELSDGEVIASGHPQLPARFTSRNVDAGWTEHRETTTGAVFHCLRMNTDQTDLTRGLWVVVQREPSGNDRLLQLAGAAGNAYADTGRTLWTDARANNATARALLRHWPDWKVTGTYDNGVDPVRTLTAREVRLFVRDSGTRVTGDFVRGINGPWVIGDFTITARHRPALLQEFAGYDDHTPEEGTPED